MRTILTALVLAVLAASPALAEHLELNILDASPSFDLHSGAPIVQIQLDKSGTQTFAEFTTAHVGQAMAIYGEDEIIATPVIREPVLEGAMQVKSEFTVQQVNELVVFLRRGEFRISVALQE